ncbi:MAG: alpha/beta hydrolase [Thiothrix sp.]|nr:alpha/beta hydrolase [Thiothrix sp.]HPE62350.1 alpha/beta hydrolase [Thiolinea sp.]
MSLGHTLIGSGPHKVLVFHGWFGDYSVWKPTFSAMDTDTFSYCFIDYRGYGKSAAQSGQYTMQEIAADASQLVLQLGWTDLHVVGHSMGGMAMQRFILDRDPGITVRSAFGVTPVPACGGQLDTDSWALFEGAIRKDENRYAILDFTTGQRLSPAWLRHMVANSRAQTSEAAYGGYLHAWARENFADEISTIRTPMQVCVGEFDGAITAEAMQATYLSWYPHCGLETLANAGHYPMQETPVRLITLMEAFMRQQF